MVSLATWKVTKVSTSFPKRIPGSLPKKLSNYEAQLLDQLVLSSLVFFCVCFLSTFNKTVKFAEGNVGWELHPSLPIVMFDALPNTD